ncbi:MAG: T9SS type A sorting domain-containing protein [Flavobacteriales bacterium]|nr:T9SS type A sorting domain-containing protein [Flavobacteriales bacterium]MBK9289231.1 T9SS type A sorting domain-containing protein [Flavobacteriales bacterium]MBL0036716.1 T9SS type A sorting domain-containing protein [Flavobacteriales bacterium]
MKNVISFFLASSSLCSFAMEAPPALAVYLWQSVNETCGNANGMIDINVAGGVPPYSYTWSNGATTEDLIGIPAGSYTVIVTDALSDQVTDSYTVQNNPNLFVPPFAQDGHGNCPGQCWGEVQVIESELGGVAPYTYNPPPDGIDGDGDPYFIFPGTCGGAEVLIQVTDALGCSGAGMQTVVEPQIGAGPMVIQSVLGSCSGSSNGSVAVSNIYNGLSWWFPPDLLLFDAFGSIIQSVPGAGNTGSFAGIAPGHYTVGRNWNTQGQYTAYPCADLDTVGFDVPDLGPLCGNVSGSVFIDNDQDCVADLSEVGVPFQVLEIQPGPVYTITDALGGYSLDIVDGSYQLAQTDPTLVQLCPVTAPVPFTISSNAVVVDLADSSTAPLNMRVQLNSGILRPGFTSTYWGTVRNTSPQLAGLVTLQVVLDPVLSYVGATPAPSTVAGNVLTWSFGAFTAYQQQALSIQVLTPIGTALGTVVNTTAEVSAGLPEADQSDNVITEVGTVTGSFDPNDKRVRTSTGWSETQYIIGDDEWLEYVIRFQNTGTDTAFTVAITDSLEADLDMATFEQGVASHGFSVQFLPGRIVKWTFANILLPDSNTNEPLSHGLVSFRIRPVQPVLPGTVISNNADIFFDFNTPVRTNDAVVVAEMTTQVAGQELGQGLSVFPNPAGREVFVVSSVGPLRSVELLAIDGRMIRSLPVMGTNAYFDLASVPSGIYFIKVLSVEGATFTQRLIHH